MVEPLALLAQMLLDDEEQAEALCANYGLEVVDMPDDPEVRAWP